MQHTSLPQKLAYFPLFDWLRFALASVVALTHEDIILWDNAGNLAVQVFFALSGWLIGGILLRSERCDLPQFFFNRVTRIWIPYLTAVIAVYFLSAVSDPVTSKHMEFLGYDLTFTHNWFIAKTPEVVGSMPLAGTGSHFWSIAVEEQFYLAAPLIIVLLPFGRSFGFWLALAAFAWITASWYGAISLGVLAAVARDRFGNWHLSRGGLAAVASVAVIATSSILMMPKTYSWAAPFIGISTVLLTSFEGRRIPVGAFLGGMSYPFYLNHWMGMFAANAINNRLPLLSVGWTAYVIALLIGAGAYVLIDRNIMRHRQAYFKQGRGRTCAALAYLLVAGGLTLGWIRAP